MKLEPNTLITVLKKNLGLLLTTLFCVISLLTYRNYGLSFDGPTQREIGGVNYDYVVKNDKKLLSYKDRIYGPPFELLLVFAEDFFEITCPASWHMRHLLTHFLFLIGGLFCFKLIDLIYKNKLLATIGFLLYVLHPRIYGHSYFNSKDIPFLAMYMISFYFAVVALKNKKWSNFLLLGISTGLLIDLRIMGVLLFVLVIAVSLFDAIREKKYNVFFRNIGIFTLSTVLVTYAFWPFLWEHPIDNFIYSFKEMSHFNWGGEILFNGSTIGATEIGWYYIPQWFLMTTPVFYSIGGLAGAILIAIKLIKSTKETLTEEKLRYTFFFFLSFFGPLLAVIVLRSNMYDGWRQMFFIYPAFIPLIIYSIYLLSQKFNLKLIVIGATLVFGLSSFRMISLYPFQNVYFNEVMNLTGDEYLRKNYELDYWGGSFLSATKYLLEVDSSEKINVHYNDWPGRANAILLLSFEELSRVNFNAKIEEADYFVTNYRYHPENYKEYDQYHFKSFKAGSNTIISIFKLKKE